MAGRQSHGRPLLPTAGSGKGKRSSNSQNRGQSTRKARATALDAFAIAAEQIGPENRARGVRTRDLEDSDDEGRPQKRQRGDGDEDDDEDDEDDDKVEEMDAGRKKRVKRDDEFDGFSDGGGDGASDTSEEWHVGVKGGDEDSDLDSEEAFGESDEERFEGFAFGGSSSKGKKKKKKKKGGEEEEEEEDSDLESLGSDAIDLATALDQFSEDEEEGEQGESGSEEEDEESSDGDDESEDDEEDEAKLDALQSMIAGFAGDDEEGDDTEMTGTGKPKLSLKDLGLFGVKDPHIKRSLRLMNKEEKAVKPGSSKKLEIPLAKRQQDRLLRTAAYEKTSETLERWIETVKHNRRADHLVFPLVQNAHDRGLDSGELMPITQKTSGTELENTILAIMEESGLGPSAKAEKKENGGDVAGESGLSQAELKEIARQRRRERELHSREMARAKRIKKIKSKAFRRIHRKELARDEQAAHNEALEAGELDSDEEREAADRRRAEERMGARHRESKWAKLGKKAGRAVWDDDFKAGLTDMTRRKEELRRRVEGRADGSDHDDGSNVSGDSGDEKDPRRLLDELNRAAAYDDDDEPRSALMQMKFMQRGEEQRKKENDELVAQMRRELDSDYEGASDEEMEIGRRQFGGKAAVTIKANTAPAPKSKAARTESTSEFQLRDETEPQPPASGGGDAWSRVEKDNRKSRRAAKTKAEELDMSIAGAMTTKPKPKPKATSQDAKTSTTADAPDSDDEHAVHFPLAIRDQELVNRAFAGEDVAGEFEREKGEIEQEDDDKVIDNTLPGWGSWAGEGVSAREKRRHQGRFITKVEGINKRDRQDFKLKDVIINEKRIRKNDKYLASQLPHPFESQQQYERSLRLPVGPEWGTKATFQDATKPRVIIKQGIIAPMSKPMY
ncbi:Utp14-domain-containing protein [Trichocladium antarcticum]|uniref:Utp14-domain-containing protein n=1 Tax=Trichocladium antarcticum TaxID=1450529 RepID=A0AAN6ULI7_9PEZI|nr:Utp14-domain-containing protein [Trichocladium antarcticum]